MATTQSEASDTDYGSTASPKIAVKKKQNDAEPSLNKTESQPPSMTVSLLMYWILPLLLFSVASRWGIVAPQTKILAKERKSKKTKSVPLDFQQKRQGAGTTSHVVEHDEEQKRIQKYSLGYQEVWNIVNQRRQKYFVPQLKSKNTKVEAIVKQQAGAKPTSSTTSTSASETTTSTTSTKSAPETPNKQEETTPPKPRQQQQLHSDNKPRGAASDPARIAAMEDIKAKRNLVIENPSDIFHVVDLADAMRHVDLLYHDGGSLQMEALEWYQTAIDLAVKQRQEAIDQNQDTSISKVAGVSSIQDEMFVSNNRDKSMDGLLCSLYTAKGKLYFMANMFEKAVECYRLALELEPKYLDALNALGSSLLILGEYQEAGEAFYTLFQNDEKHIFNDVFTGMAKVLTVKETNLKGGWKTMVNAVESLIPKLHDDLQLLRSGNQSGDAWSQQEQILAESLTRLHHAMFTYHDVKTKKTGEAWDHLFAGYRYKMSVLPQWNANFEAQKVAQTMQIFKSGFWPPNVGSDTSTPIFIIGFVRSGSTLLERVLDAHSFIVGTGEDSVFNGRLDEIRNDIVQASWTGSTDAIQSVVQDHADGVVRDMRQRWQTLESQVQRDSKINEPLRFADKMLTNYMNVGFLHMLFPKALILHVAREPMDTVFSAYKHEFPAGTLDYTSDFPSLAQLYKQYRSLIRHWDTVLPGRITHVRYEDMVHDMPGMARAIVHATGLEWEDSVLDFYKKRHAVNTLSTTQVRKNVYKDSLNAWKRYEQQLQPLVTLLGDDARWDLKTSLPSYVKPKDGDGEL